MATASEVSNEKAGTSSANEIGVTMETLCSSRGDTSEVKQLKDLVLVHLDLIQQQQELLLAKDRQIRQLKSDKEAVRFVLNVFRF